MATDNRVVDRSSFLEHIDLTRFSEVRSSTDKINIEVYITHSAALLEKSPSIWNTMQTNTG